MARAHTHKKRSGSYRLWMNIWCIACRQFIILKWVNFFTTWCHTPHQICINLCTFYFKWFLLLQFLFSNVKSLIFFYVYAFSTALYRVHFSKCNYSMRMRRTFYGTFYLNVCALFDSIAMKLFKKKFSLDIQELQHVEVCVIVAIDTENEPGTFYVSQPAKKRKKIHFIYIYCYWKSTHLHAHTYANARGEKKKETLTHIDCASKK